MKSLSIYDVSPGRSDLLEDVLAGLARQPKQLPCKLLYDERGSELFDRICTLDEYYPTRTELRIMRRDAARMSAALGPRCLLVEYGSGSSLKTRLLLDHLQDPAGYVPVDISRTHLERSAMRLANLYPQLPMYPVCADFTAPFHLPEIDASPEQFAVYFPGSTIGNFGPDESIALLRGIAEFCGPGGGLLIGVDLKKRPQLLEAAYNDARGVTAAFNLNLLAHVNRALGADFRLDRFRHYAHYNAVEGRVEMHLVSLADQSVTVAGETFRLRRGETIHTENSYKYGLRQFAELAGSAGWEVNHVWTDPDRLFSVQYLRA